MSESVLFEIRDGIATITLNRPDRYNAWNLEMATAFEAAAFQASHSQDARVVIVTGSGRGFCGGADSSRLEQVAQGGGSDPWARPPVLSLADLDKPVVAAINGGCAGIGLLIALLCDVRFAAAGAKLATAYARRGLPAEYGMSWLLARTVGVGHCADLLLSGRTITAEEGLIMGLVNRVCPPDDVVATARQYALDIAANCSPAAMRMMKRQQRLDWETSFRGSVHYAVSLLDRANKSDDFREGVQSFVEKRPPQFKPIGDAPNA